MDDIRGIDTTDASAQRLQEDGAPSINPTLKKRVRKIVDGSTPEDVVSALRDLTTVYPKNTPHTRWNLRDQLERRVLSSTDTLLASFSGIEAELKQVLSDIESVKQHCLAMENRLKESEQVSGGLIQQAEELLQSERQCRLEIDVTSAFLERFQLSPEQQASIRSDDVTAAFFDSLTHAHQIQSESKALLRLPNQHVGIETSTNIAEFIDFAYKKLYQWMRTEIQQNFESETPTVKPLVATAFQALQERNVLMESCIEEIGALRNRSIVKSFIDALTKGGPNGIPRPIEIHAHDPRRYVSDMAAWLHQALASEQELAALLFRLVRKDTLEEQTRHSANIESLLRMSFKDACRPFRVRVDQVLVSPLVTPVTAFSLSSTLSFYMSRFVTLAGPNNPLAQCFEGCHQDCLKTYQRLFSELAEKAKGVQLTAALQELSAGRELLELIQIIREVAVICNNSLTPTNQQDHSFASLFSAAAASIVAVVKAHVQSGRLAPVEEATYTVNCLDACIRALGPFEAFVAGARSQLQTSIANSIDLVTHEQSASVLKSSGISAKIAALNTYLAQAARNQLLSEYPGMDANSLQSCFRAFENILLDMGTLNMPMLARFENSELRRAAKTSVANQIVDAYSRLYSAAIEQKSGYAGADLLIRYKPDEAKQILLNALE